jgi:hypothetical protein
MADELTPEQLAEYDAESVRLINEQLTILDEILTGYESLKAEAATAKKRSEAEQDKLNAMIRERRKGRGKGPEKTLLDFAKPAKWRQQWTDSLDIPLDLSSKLMDSGLATAGEVYDQFATIDPAADGTPLGLPLADVAAIREACQRLIDHESAAAEAAVTDAVPDHLWRDYPIAEWVRFGITPKDVEKLAAGEVKRETGRSPINTVGDLSNFTQPTASGYTRGYADIKGLGPAGADRISEAETKFWAWWGGGGAVEFAKERGLIGNGDATEPGPGSGNPETPASAAEQDDDATDPDGTDLYENAIDGPRDSEEMSDAIGGIG